MGMGNDGAGAPVDGPLAAALGTADAGNAVDYMWMDPVTENPGVGDTEVWEFYNTTGDAHPMHVHAVTFEVIDRERLAASPDTDDLLTTLQPTGEKRGPEAWERGRKDMVIAYPGEVTRIKATFETRGQFVWHCHIVEHEDNEMMRPFRIGRRRFGQPG
jgi:FtsP/CotA-like multicopper oxidase with cupredoxin domain